MKLTKQYMAFYKTWLSVYIIDVILNLAIYNLLIAKFYKSEFSQIGLERIDRDKPMLEIQLVTYAVITAVILFFVLKSIRKTNRVETGALYGAILGIVIFLSHNIFNHALFKDWTVALVIIDSGWGILQGMIIGALSVILYDRFS